MKKLEEKIITIICMVVVFISVFYSSATVQADGLKTVYLDAINGNDNNSGTSELPWRTLQKAQSSVNSGDTVILRDGSYGRYYETSVNRNSWVTYKAQGGHSPEFTSIMINWSGAASNTYLRFDGITIKPGADDKYAISIRNSRHTEFLNLNVIGYGARYTLYGFITRWCSDITVDGCTFSGGDKTGSFDGFDRGVYFRDSNDVIVTNNEIRQFHNIGIKVDSTNSVVKNNNVHTFGGDAGIGFSGGKGGLIIENNKIHGLKLYCPELKEKPTKTTWSEDGTVMSNPDANWGSESEPFDWVRNIEIYIKSGTNVKLGDKEIRVAKVISPKQIVFDGSIKNDPNGPTPSNVDYYFRDQAHADLIQGYGNCNTHDVVIRGNELYDNLDGWSFMHLRIKNAENPDNIGGFNFLIENNLCWNFYKDDHGETSHPLNIENIDGLVFRNNTIIGKLQVRYNKNITFSSNIVSFVSFSDQDTAEFVNNDFNIFNRGILPASYNRGSNTTFLYPGYSWNKWNAASFTSIFGDYQKGDFRHASGTSLAVGHSSQLNSPSIDIDGKNRDKTPDAGCYEFLPKVIQPITGLLSPPSTLNPDSGKACNE